MSQYYDQQHWWHCKRYCHSTVTGLILSTHNLLYYHVLLLKLIFMRILIDFLIRRRRRRGSRLSLSTQARGIGLLCLQVWLLADQPTKSKIRIMCQKVYLIADCIHDDADITLDTISRYLSLFDKVGHAISTMIFKSGRGQGEQRRPKREIATGNRR